SRGNFIIQVNHWDTDLYIVMRVGCNTKYSTNRWFSPVPIACFGKPEAREKPSARPPLIAGSAVVVPLKKNSMKEPALGSPRPVAAATPGQFPASREIRQGIVRHGFLT